MVQKYRTKLFVASMAAIHLIATQSSGGSDALPPVHVASDSHSITNKYCGLYSLLAAGKHHGVVVPADRLFTPVYLTGQFGSSVDDLLRACNDFGLVGEHRENLTHWDLLNISDPTICLVKSSIELPVYNHWVLVKATGLNSMRIYDSQVGFIDVSPAEFLSIWDGTGIIVMRETPRWSLGDEVLRHLLAIFGPLALASIALALANAAARGRRPLFPILFASVSLAILMQAGLPTSLLRNWRMTESVARAYHEPSYEIVTARDFDDFDRANTLLIDARPAEMYSLGHIPGSINVPIDTSAFRISGMLAGYPSESRVVIYCQSSECKWAELLARNTHIKRFAHVAVFRGGLKEYLESGRSTTKF